jgi:HTH-type transcriptional regulator / antitoxin MqsA
MKCPACGKAQLVRETRDLPYTYKGESTVVRGITGDFCPSCGEGVLDTENLDRYGDGMRLFQRKVNAEFVDPEYIVRVRRKLDLDQREAAELFGGGINGFSRYENGKTKPPVALVKLLRLLDHHPELLAEVREGDSVALASRTDKKAKAAAHA